MASAIEVFLRLVVSSIVKATVRHLPEHRKGLCHEIYEVDSGRPFLMCLMPLAVFAQTPEPCESYEIITVDTPNFSEAGLDLATLRCTTIFVTNEDGETVNVFVIPESSAGAYLRGADLSGQDLTQLDLSFANLRDATLRDISASGVMFIGADFSNADLSESDVSYAYFNFATLVNASLVDADLQWAELSQSDMRDTDLTGANMDNVIGYDK